MPEEQTIRLIFFFGTLVVVTMWEFIAHQRVQSDSKTGRWFTNLSLVLLNTIAVRFLLPILPGGIKKPPREVS